MDATQLQDLNSINSFNLVELLVRFGHSGFQNVEFYFRRLSNCYSITNTLNRFLSKTTLVVLVGTPLVVEEIFLIKSCCASLD